jgi:O-antigen/teichoic acid export membrane protein
MNYFRKLWDTWKQDKMLGVVVRNTGYLFSGNALSVVLIAIQGFLAAALLGPSYFGVLTEITVFASSVNRLLSFRMGDVVVKYAGQYLALGQKDRAAAVIKAAGITEGLTSIIAYLVLALLTPLAAKYVLHDPTMAPWILYYGLSLLGALIAETSTAVLQIGNHFRNQAFLTFLQSAVSAGWITVAFFTKGDVFEVLNAYLAGKLIYNIGLTVMAVMWVTPMLGKGWWKTPISLIEHKGQLAQYAISTNLSSTINTIIRDNEPVWIGMLTTSQQAGYFSFAWSIMNAAYLPVNSFVTTTFPQIASSVARREWNQLKRLLTRTSAISAAWNLACGLGLLLVGPFVLGWYKHGAYLPALSTMLLFVIGMGIPNIFFWNRPLLLAFGKPNYPLVVNTVVGAAKTALMFALVPVYGFMAETMILSGYFLLSIGMLTWRGLQEFRQAEAKYPESDDA